MYTSFNRQTFDQRQRIFYQFSFDPVVEEHGDVGRFDDLPERGRDGVFAAFGEADGVSEDIDAVGVVEMGNVVVSEAGGLDEVAAVCDSDAV